MKQSLSFLFLLMLSGVLGLTGCPSQDVKDSKSESVALDAGQASKSDAAVAEQQAPPPPRKTLSELLTEARNLKAAGNYKDAIAKYKEALQRKSSLYSVWYNVGVLEDYLDPNTGGATSYQKALSLKSDFYPAINNLFRLYLRQKRRSQAASLIQNKASAHPKNFQIRNLMIRYYIYAKRYGIAERMAREIQRKDERNAEAILNLGLVWFFQKKFELSQFALRNTLKICKDALNKQKKSKATPKKAAVPSGPKVKARKRSTEEYRLLLPEIHYYLSFVRLKLRGENKKNYQYIVSNHLEPALKIRPVYPEAMTLLGEMQLRLGQFAKAEALMRKVIKLNPQIWSAQLSLGIALTEQGKREEAAQQFISILKKNPYYSVAHYQLGILYLDGSLKANFGAIRPALYDREIPVELKKVKRLLRTVKALVRWGTAAYHLSTFVNAKSSLPTDAPARGYLKTAQKQFTKMKKRLKQRVRSERRKYLKRLKKKKKSS